MVRLRSVLWVWVVCAVSAWASPIEDARRLVDDLEFAPALKVLDQLEKSEGLDAATLREVWLLQGIAYGTSGKEAKTRDAFRKLLMVFPDATLPPDAPPRVRTPFLEAKDWASAQGLLTVTASVGLNAGQVTALKVTVGSKDVLRLARFARFTVKADGGAPQVTELALQNGVAEVPPGGKRVEWTVDVLTERHSILLSVSRTDGGAEAPARVGTSGASSTAPDGGGAVASHGVNGAWRRPVGGVLLGLGAAAAGVGVAFGVMSGSAAQQLAAAERDGQGRVLNLTQRDFAAREAEANTQALVANVLFGAGAALGVAGVVLIIVGPSGEPVAQLAPAGPGLLLSGSF